MSEPGSRRGQAGPAVGTEWDWLLLAGAGWCWLGRARARWGWLGRRLHQARRACAAPACPRGRRCAASVPRPACFRPLARELRRLACGALQARRTTRLSAGTSTSGGPPLTTRQMCGSLQVRRAGGGPARGRALLRRLRRCQGLGPLRQRLEEGGSLAVRLAGSRMSRPWGALPLGVWRAPGSS